MKNSHFPIGTLSIYFVLESIENFLEGVLFVCVFLNYFPDVPIGPTTQELFDVEKSQYMTLYFFAHYI
jgi:hypothetical protein